MGRSKPWVPLHNFPLVSLTAEVIKLLPLVRVAKKTARITFSLKEWLFFFFFKLFFFFYNRVGIFSEKVR